MLHQHSNPGYSNTHTQATPPPTLQVTAAPTRSLQQHPHPGDNINNHSQAIQTHTRRLHQNSHPCYTTTLKQTTPPSKLRLHQHIHLGYTYTKSPDYTTNYTLATPPPTPRLHHHPHPAYTATHTQAAAPATPRPHHQPHPGYPNTHTQATSPPTPILHQHLRPDYKATLPLTPRLTPKPIPSQHTYTTIYTQATPLPRQGYTNTHN